MQRLARLGMTVGLFVALAPLSSQRLLAQGVTTGAIGGTVTGAGGAPLEGANVRIVDPETGFARTTQTRATGAYNVSGLEVGDYRVSVTAIGYAPRTVGPLHVNLAQTTRADVVMEQQAQQVAEVVVSAAADATDFTPTRTGAQTYISDSLVTRLPTLNRQIQDFVRTVPQVSLNPGRRGDLSAAGQNNRFNAIQVDGTTQNDRFGLGETGELGGQANGRGISLEAVKEFQVVLSPYNVTQGGFTGALLNAVTKNGTNDLRLTGFYTYRGNDLATRDSVFRAGNSKFGIKQYGGSVGGPIIKDKLHFFVSAEGQAASRPAGGPFVGQTGVSGTNAVRVDQALVDQFNSALATYGLSGGSGAEQNNENPIVNAVGRVDWQISPSTRLVLREIYDDTKAQDFSRDAAVFALTSNRFQRAEKANSITGQLFKTFSSGATNETQVGWVRQRFARTFDDIFPQISIVNVPSPTVAGQLVTLRAGPDSSSHINQLDQDFIEFRNDFTFLFPGASNHLITVGTRDDHYKIRNAFWQNKFGSYAFPTIDALIAGTPSAYAVGVGLNDPVAHFSTLNLAGYIQDQWSLNPSFTLTLGLRADGPVFLDKPGYRPEVEADLDRRTDEVPSNITWNPRIGFNWDVASTGRLQLRGGAGMFTGIQPYVWLSNVFTNNGLNGVAQVTCNGSTSTTQPPAFNATNIATPPQACVGQTPPTPTGATIGAVNTVDPDFKQPQVFRSTLGADVRLGHGFIGTVDFLYTKAYNSPYMVNQELPDPVGTGYDGRVMYGTLAANGRATVAYRHGTKYSGGDFDLRNSSKDYSYSISTGLTKRFSGSWEGNVFYTYGRSYSVQDFTSSVARSNFINGRATAYNQFDQRLDPSSFDRPHRVNASMTWTAPWKNYPTDVSLIYVGQSGTNFAYVYQTGVTGSGDLNADGLAGNDLAYIPNSPSELTFEAYTGVITNGARRIEPGSPGASHLITAQEQADSFASFLRQTPCVDKQRGKIMTRGSCKNPWFNTLDLSVRQSLPALGRNRLTLQADVYNFLNFLNSDWGKFRQNTTFQTANLFQHRGQTADGKPILRFDPSLANRDTKYPVSLGVANYWQAQVTVRYAY